MTTISFIKRKFFLPVFHFTNQRITVVFSLGKNINLSEITAPEGVIFLDDPESVVLACVSSSGGASDEEGADDEAEEGIPAEEAEPETAES